MSLRHLIDSFESWRRDGERIVLATVVATAGSTYSKAGAQMLISGSGQFRGLLSGGCLEGDLTEHAREVLASGEARIVSYDMRNRDEDELWGLGLGCDGSIDIFLQALGPAYEPFAAIARRVAARRASTICTVLASPLPDLRPGATLIAGDGPVDRDGVPDACAEAVEGVCAARASRGGAARERLTLAGGAEIEVLAAVVPAPARLLLLGAGPDVVPLVRIARELGWYVTVADHRPAYVERMRDSVDEALLVEPARLRNRLDPAAFDAAVIMSHHLRSDREYLRSLAGTDLPFIGLLGPRARRERLLGDLGPAGPAVADRLYGPVGLDLGADTPQGIALAIAAQVQAVLKGRSPAHLDR
jgi:xanthine/CO dehydrogenase XdhC/CoxF family maturation factor